MRNATLWFSVTGGAYIAAFVTSILPYFVLGMGGEGSLAATALILTLATVAGIVGTRLSFLGRPAPVILTIAFVVSGAILIAGPTLMLRDLLAETGFNNIGLGLFALLGMALMLPMAIVAIVLAAVVGARHRRLHSIMPMRP